MDRVRTLTVVGTLLAVLVPASAADAAAPAGHARAAVRAKKPPVVVIVMENHEFGSIKRSRSAPYLTGTFRHRGTLFTRYHALHHPSLPNYLDMTSGTTSGCRSDSCPRKTYKTDNLFHQLSHRGIGWVAWQESMPKRCALNSSGTYAVKHNPAAYYRDLFPKTCPKRDRPYPSKLPRALPPFTFITPNECHDMHDCSIAVGDRWLKAHVPPLLKRGAVVVITFDEGTTSEGGGGHVYTVVAGPGVKRGAKDGHRYTHEGLLAGLERWFGVARLHGAKKARPLPI
jgi:hypothetical protein